ncbi:Transcriptional regulator, AraC family protein [Minicystis rosea]|nr:Transcriptional regulator, AraC family protein [Minicystis rosea]
MSYREIVPHSALRPFVDRFWIHAGTEGARASARRILPDGCIDVLIHLAHGGRAVAVGAMTKAFITSSDAAWPIAAVRFRPGGAAPFLRLSVHELTDRHVDAIDLGHAWLDDPRESTADAAVSRIERSLLAKLSSVSAPDRRIARAVDLLFGPDAPSIDALAQHLGWSRQHLGRAFRSHVGIGPKQLARVARVQRAIDALQRDRGERLAATAAGLGYFDEAHMALDFREIVGLTPGEVRAARGSIFPIRSLLDAP